MVLFDMDGLLLDTERAYLNCCNIAGAEFGVPDLTDTYISTIGLREIETRPIFETALRGYVDIDVFWTRWDVLIGTRLAQGISVKTGVLVLLKHLQGEGIGTVVATSTHTSTARKHLQRAGLLPYFVDVIGGDQVVSGKPNPEIYHKAAAVFGRKAEDCVVFEDSDMGVLAGVRSGARVVQVPDLKRPAEVTLALGHVIAPNLLTGARAVGLMR